LALPKVASEAAVETTLIGMAAEQSVDRAGVQMPKPWRLRSAEERREFFEARRTKRRVELEKRALPHMYAVKPRPKPMTSRDPRVFRDLRDVLGIWAGGPHASRAGEEGHSERSYQLFVDLVERMLEWDPAVRIKPMEALNHPFLREDIEGRGGAVEK
jgi:serine/threonine protein kinase